jgi:RNA polymerase sigma-70 factor (ECF subfamily)
MYSWVFGILNNKIYEFYRQNKKKKNQEKDVESILFDEAEKWKEEEFFLETNSQQEYMDKLIVFLTECFKHLKETYKAVFSLKYFNHKTTDEICQICDISKENVWQIFHRGKLQLKTCIQNHLKNHHVNM